MATPGRLSLRARMLIVLIGVTTLFLLVMGAVSTVVLARGLTQDFRASLNAAASRLPARGGAIPAGYTVAAVSERTGQVILLTPGQPGRGLEPALGRQDWAAYFLQAPGQLVTLTTVGGERMRAVARPVRALRLRLDGIPVTSAGPYALVVARPAGVVASQVRRLVIAELITGGVLIAVLAAGGEWLIGRGLRPLRRMAGTADAITSSGDLTERMPDSGDGGEVGTLGAAINTMLDRIQHAFGARLRSEQKVRQFAADASHELRTPLTTISGYAELYRQGALGPDQLPGAMRRIEQEAGRMSRLVAELLELARLDRTSSLDLTETDLAGVVRDAVADAAAVEPQRPARAEAPPRLIAVVDEPRIRQVLANLLGNVRAHTPVTAPVSVRLGEVTGGVLIEVADAGPGMSQQDAARAFDRFHRGPDRAGDGAAGGGSGLGLSIVQAIATAHGGQATLESWPGRGTRVRIWLPSAPVPADAAVP
jgi:signal transduction histidine kinase